MTNSTDPDQLLQKPTDLDLHCLQRLGIAGFSRTRINTNSCLFLTSERFFEDRFETELHQFKESIHEMIQEQQGHVRQIVHRATCTHDLSSQVCTKREHPEDGL